MKRFGEISKPDYTQYHSKRIDDLDKRINRWHDKQMNFLSSTITLFSTFSFVSLGYVIKNFKNELFDNSSLWGYDVGRTMCLILILSLVFGAIATLSRFWDYRLTTHKIRNRRKLFIINKKLIYEADEPYSYSKIRSKAKTQGKIANFLGRATYFFVVAQVLSFIGGLVFILINV